MKNWMKYLLTSVLLLTVLSPCRALAKDSGEAYFVNMGNNEVAVYLNLPEAQAGNVTSVRFQVYVDLISQGNLSAEPAFTLAGMTSAVQNVSTTYNEEDHEYCLDVILSGDSTQNIFHETVEVPVAIDGTGSLETGRMGTYVGTIKLQPESFPFYATVGMLDDDVTDEQAEPEADEGEEETERYTPMVEYVNGGGAQVLKSHITNLEMAVLRTRSLADSECTVTIVGEALFVYDGTAKEPTVQVMYGENELTKGTDYQVSYEDNINAGMGRVVVEGIGTYGGTNDVTFPIEQAELPANAPVDLQAPYSAKTLADVTLPEGWTWKDADVKLVPETTVSGVAVYSAEDAGNYKTLEVTVSVTQEAAPQTEPQPDAPPTPPTPTEPSTPATPTEPSTPGATTSVVKNGLATPTLTAQTSVGSKSVKLKWKKDAKAAGYHIYLLNTKTGKYERVKKISKGSTVSCTLTYSYGKKLTFKMRAYRMKKGKKVYGEYSAPVEVTVPKFNKSAAVKKANGSVQSGSRQVTFTWKKAAGADGYQIFYKTGKQKFKHLATVEGADALTYTSDALAWGTAYTFKVRAYALNESGEKVCGKCSAVFKLTTPPEAVQQVAVKDRGNQSVRITWDKVKKAAGYRIYRSTSADGKFTRIKTVTGANTLKYVDKKVESGQTYYYKVRAYVVNQKGKKVLGKLSDAQSVTVE